MPPPLPPQILDNVTEGVLGRAAVGYAERGWRVIPLNPGGKAPCGTVEPGMWERGEWSNPTGEPRWSRPGGSSSDPDQVRSWWERQPFANIGLRTGTVNVGGSGADCIDVDAADSLSLVAEVLGAETMAAMRLERTPRGFHIYVAARPKRVSVVSHNTSRFDGTIWERAHIDVKASGAYVVAAPSVYAGCSMTRGTSSRPQAPTSSTVSRWRSTTWVA